MYRLCFERCYDAYLYIYIHIFETRFVPDVVCCREVGGSMRARKSAAHGVVLGGQMFQSSDVAHERSPVDGVAGSGRGEEKLE